MSRAAEKLVLRTAAGLAEAGVALTGVLSAAGFFGNWHWTLDLLSHFRLQAIVSLAVGGVLLLALRRFRWAMAALAGSALLAATLVPLILKPRQPEGGNAFKIVVFNVLSNNPHHRATLEFLQSEPADLLLLLEVTETWRDSLAPLAEVYPHEISEYRSDNFGMQLLSKSPLDTAELHALSPGVPMVELPLVVGGRAFTFFGIHPLPPSGKQNSASRDLYFEQLAQRIETRPGDVVVAGDFNATPFASVFRKLAARFELGNAGLNPTWMRDTPVFALPLDHILVSPDLRILDHGLGPDLGSDHRPVISVLGL